MEEYLENENTIEFWYKNGVKTEKCFWILYEYEWKKSVFYPDFIVKYKYWKIGIFDTKDGNTAESMETKIKAECLQTYINETKDLFWGIVIKQKNICSYFWV
jgi:type III restriction enzyme